MKKYLLGVIAAGMLFTTNPLKSNTIDEVAPIEIKATKSENDIKVKAIEMRINEINAMDKSNLTASEKRSLRKEVRSMRSQLNDLGGGVYISVGGIIIILLLIIILL